MLWTARCIEVDSFFDSCNFNVVGRMYPRIYRRSTECCLLRCCLAPGVSFSWLKRLFFSLVTTNCMLMNLSQSDGYLPRHILLQMRRAIDIFEARDTARYPAAGPATGTSPFPRAATGPHTILELALRRFYSRKRVLLHDLTMRVRLAFI